MVFVSVTRLRVKSVAYLIPFLIANERSVKELRKTKGFYGGIELIDKNLTFWTATMWLSDNDMKSFCNSAAHRKAMQGLPVWCDEAAYLHWLQSDTEIPDWESLHQKIITEGKITKVRHPSANQNTMNYPVVKWKKLGRKFKAGKDMTI